MISHIEWINPLWTAALPLAFLTPLLAHLLARRSGRLAVFPTIRFLQQALADESRWRRPVDWLLLLLRMLILAMVILAFARPILVEPQPLNAPSSSGRAVVIILDASASMQRTEQGFTLFDRARQQAVRALQSLDPVQDRALVIVLDASPRPLLPMMSSSFSQLIARMESLTPTWQNGELTSALSLAARPPMHAEDPINLADLEIHLYSDMQKTQWPDTDTLAKLLRNRRLVLHPLGSDSGNVALRRPRLQPASPIVGQLAQASVEVVNHSDQPIQTQVMLTVERSGGQSQLLPAQPITLPARSTTQAQFSWPVNAAGLHHLSFALASAGGAIEADDRTGLFVETARARRVALVTTGSTADPDDAAYFMYRALMPAVDAQGNDVHVEVWPPAELMQRLTSSPPAVVVMLQTGAMEPDWLVSLQDYLRQGGGVWWIIDSQLAAQSLQRWRDEQNQPVSPIVARNAASAWQVGAERTLARGSFDDPMLRVFQGSVRSALLSPRFSQSLSGTLADDAQGLLYFQDDQPALAARWIGQGRLAILAGSLSPRRSDWVKLPVFVPLVHQLIRGLSPGPMPQANPWAGTPLHFRISVSPQESRLLVMNPQGQETAAAMAHPVGDGWEVSQPAADLPGLYRVIAQQGSTRTLLAGVQVDVSELESDLTPWQPVTLPSTGDGSSPAEVTTSDASDLREHAPELWPGLIATAIGLLLVESLLAGWGYRRFRQARQAGGER